MSGLDRPADASGLTAPLLLMFGLAVTFGGCAMATAIMSLPQR